MDLSIIIPSFNTKELLTRCLATIDQSLEKSAITYEVIVVDNASDDGTREILEKKRQHCVPILNKANLGYGKANNLGIHEARGTYILLLNSDIEVVDTAIPSLYKFAVAQQKTFVGGKLLNADGTPQASAGKFYSLQTVLLMLFFKGDRLGITRSSPDTITHADWVSGACLIGKKRDFTDAGLFDENIFMYMDEVDFLYRARQKGYTTMFYPEAQFLHIGAASSEGKKTPVINIYRGLVFFYSKHARAWEQHVLNVLLRTKAYIAIIIGRITGNSGLVTLYEKALAMVP